LFGNVSKESEHLHTGTVTADSALSIVGAKENI